MLEIPVKLIVKAPNQQFEDQTIHCNLSWTIKRLKGYLSEVYPSKPNTEDQRLIYYGQLLNDSVTLKDVFMRYEAEEETHTVHLVCMPSKENLKMQARKISEETIRKEREGLSAPGGSRSTDRISPGGSENGSQQDVDPSRTAETSYYPPSGYQQYWLNNFYPQPSDNYNYTQQLAWMQRMYTNYYMSQYMDMIARQNGGVFREGYVDPRQTEAPRNPGPQPRREEEEDPYQLVREWLLDLFYTLGKLLIFFSIVVSYSSATRFLIVIVPGILFYLYYTGFLRMNQAEPVENNNEVANNNARGENNAAAQQQEGNEAAPAEEDQRGDSQNQEPVAEAPERPSFIALTWTFVTTFFSSMIPEVQNQI